MGRVPENAGHCEKNASSMGTNASTLHPDKCPLGVDIWAAAYQSAGGTKITSCRNMDIIISDPKNNYATMSFNGPDSLGRIPGCNKIAGKWTCK